MGQMIGMRKSLRARILKPVPSNPFVWVSVAAVGFLMSCGRAEFQTALEPNRNAGRRLGVLPFSLDRGLPFVELTIQGHRVELLLDTGLEAFPLILEPDVVERLTVNPAGISRGYRTVYGTRRWVRLSRIPSIQLGSIEYRNITVVMDRFPSPVKRGKGVLGRKFFDPFAVLFDYRNRRVLLFNPQTGPPDSLPGPWKPWPLRRDGSTRGRLGGVDRSLRLAFDTGSSFIVDGIGYSVMVNRKVLPLFESMAASRVMLDGKSIPAIRGACIEASPGSGALCDLNFLLQAYPLPDRWDVLLGYDFFSKYLVYIQAKENRAWVKPLD